MAQEVIDYKTLDDASTALSESRKQLIAVMSCMPTNASTKAVSSLLGKVSGLEDALSLVDDEPIYYHSLYHSALGFMNDSSFTQGRRLSRKQEARLIERVGLLISIISLMISIYSSIAPSESNIQTKQQTQAIVQLQESIDSLTAEIAKLQNGTDSPLE